MPLNNPLPNLPRPIPKPATQKINSKGLFGGRDEISRTEMRMKLRNSADVYKAQRAVGLNLTKEERVKLEKTALPGFYGGRISKTELKNAASRLEKERMSSSLDNKTKETLRKEAKFFRKLGENAEESRKTSVYNNFKINAQESEMESAASPNTLEKNRLWGKELEKTVLEKKVLGRKELGKRVLGASINNKSEDSKINTPKLETKNDILPGARKDNIFNAEIKGADNRLGKKMLEKKVLGRKELGKKVLGVSLNDKSKDSKANIKKSEMSHAILADLYLENVPKSKFESAVKGLEEQKREATKKIIPKTIKRNIPKAGVKHNIRKTKVRRIITEKVLEKELKFYRRNRKKIKI